LAKIIRGMFYVVFTVFGGLCGYSAAVQSVHYFDVLTGLAVYANFAAMVLLGVLLGFALAPLVAALALRSIDSLTRTLQHLSLQEVMMGSAGLLFGLIVAFFANLALQQINFTSIPLVGVFLNPFLTILSTIFLATLGAFFGSRLVFIHSFKELLESGPDARGWQSTFFLLDTSVIVDGRLSSLVEIGFLEGSLVVPHFVLLELQMLADSEDTLRRARGRRGLDLLDKLRLKPGVQVENKDYEERGVDAKLVRLAKDMKSPLVTTDYNLQKVAVLQGVKVLNINELAACLRPVVVAGEELVLRVTREGKEQQQGVGYLDDGTMIVIEKGRSHVGETVAVEISSVVQTSAGKMIFARYRETVSGRTSAELSPPKEKVS
jgi:uncharacterized protein YacL